MTKIIEITDRAGNIVEPAWIAKAEFVHRQLRPHLPENYVTKMKRVFEGGGRMCVAERDGAVAGVAVYRIHENTSSGMHMYVDDLVTDESQRSRGVGKALLDYLQTLARELKCETFKLDSGTQRQQAHKFYFREGMTVHAFHFLKSLKR